MAHGEVRGVLRGAPGLGGAGHERLVVEGVQVGEQLVAPEREGGHEVFAGVEIHPGNIASGRRRVLVSSGLARGLQWLRVGECAPKVVR
jgi:hypothetical protein